ncbi:MAG: histidine kinase [Ignavibacteriaceae bacterium]|nr:histidine kinase [Ignavibacteriaceae bacterium]
MFQHSPENFFNKIAAKRGYPSFWFFNAVGWILLIAADSFIVSPEYVLDSWHNFFSNAIQWAVGFVITIGLRFIYKRFHYKHKQLLFVLGFILSISLISSIILYYTAHFIFLSLNPELFDQYLEIIFSLNYMAQRMTGVFPLMTTWSLLYFGIKFWLDWSRERDRAEKLDLLAQSAQLQMLRYQVNPHFLFNSFSSLRALIRSNQVKAEEMVSKLSEFYRYSLTTKNNSEVPLIEEIEAIEHYFEIEKIRFGNKLEFHINIDSLAEEYPVPCFLIHPLVENAIKYGMKTSNLPLIIKIDALVKNDNLIICVANSGRWLNDSRNSNIQSTKTGLSNIRSRLEYSFPDNHKINIKQEDGFVNVVIEIFKEVK